MPLRKILLLLLSFQFSSVLAADAVPIFILHSYSQEYPWTKGQHQGFIETLNDDISRTYTFNVEYLDTKRTGYNPAYADLIAQYMHDKYQNYRPAAVYVTDDNALAFALSNMDKIFPGVPVFFSGINNYDVKSRLDPAHSTGVFEKKEIAPNLRLMHSMDESVQSIVIVGDESETYRAITSEIQAELTQHPELQVTYLSETLIDDLVGQLKTRKEQYVFLTTLGAIKDRENHTSHLRKQLKK